MREASAPEIQDLVREEPLRLNSNAQPVRPVQDGRCDRSKGEGAIEHLNTEGAFNWIRKVLPMRRGRCDEPIERGRRSQSTAEGTTELKRKARSKRLEGSCAHPNAKGATPSRWKVRPID